MSIKIALLSGGISGEREVSLRTGEKIFEALDKKKYEVFRYDPKTDMEKFFTDASHKKFDLVFPALHGPYGEDGRLQGLLDILNIPYVFSGCLPSALAMDKHKAKIIAKTAGLETAEDLILNRNTQYNFDQIAERLSFPIVIKPAQSGSSVGMSIAENKNDLEKGIREAFSYDNLLILEKFIKGREFTVAVMGKDNPEALPVIEIIPKVSKWFDHQAKYEVGGSDEICPAEIPDPLRDRLQEAALKVFRAVGCKDLARADFIWSEEDDKLYFLEINTIPGMTATSLAPKAAQAAGMDFPGFLEKLISYNIKNYEGRLAD